MTVIESLFGSDRVDFAMLHKIYGVPTTSEATSEARYGPPKCTGIDIRIISGDPDPDRILTSYVERQNLTMRMGMRRFTRLTNGFSKKTENHSLAVSLHFFWYNFGHLHQSLTIKREGLPGIKRTPAMAAGVSLHPWSVTQIAQLLD